ncbi:MAG: Glycerol-3-phosphate acyltransferase [Caldanaerobacter subterraneus]|jgi:glycerol-3-phosphate acyltransferase PlsY|uniref:Glycerol-3-phosphate acyltransferase n=1 Tax=Thermoanaerobacter sp. (strain X514) TaxID=399726 RepID=PLSY_THEPX|nr:MULTISPECIES: glycerol-3-phosphate 1-O-acyltransferase PlsY [unclassified Thermoanaerobacter]B0K3E3.1 RecName: Full=Glycerol-3-phosphate acyltransferase; AltName: Full=Acyl-PO4 G3P acyltransferase; AltName: Full=Acyl-phosphate--glycerol-3-phosphate acyltransferase; AltName: Full=G3P acyltransferase; Short=GPAT; AltName: Full=Lysophosphatidic acid synthase; Short=LPA synthase [Thermoanaerobacter sp. X514]KUJ90264.1 MAG: membrane protein [Thermoanaerobacter thermocopriae]KUK34312.1 MAG: Glycero
MYAVLTAIIAYLIGCINNAYIFTKYTRNIDIRNYGSGNAGATNVLRVLGYKAAAPVFALDVLKGVIAVLIGKYLMGNTGAMIAGIAVVCGHNWPVFLKFRGGKGIATSVGVVMTVSPLLGLIALAIGVTVIVLTKYVSLGSITGSVTFVLLNAIFWNSTQIFIFSLILASLAIFQHRSNIKRLLAGTESKLGQKTEIK